MATVTSAPVAATPLFMQAVSGDDPINYNAADFAKLTSAIWQSPGVLTATSFRLEALSTPAWQVKVRAGYAIVGTYLVYNAVDFVLNVSTFNTSPTATRVHYVYLVIYDKAVYGTEYSARLVAVEDTGSGVTPPLGAATLLLGSFTISPGQANLQNSNISPKPLNASDAGGFQLLNPTYLYSYVTDAGGTFAPARARYGNGRVYLSGAIKRVDNASFAAATNWNFGYLPEWMSPRYDVYVNPATSVHSGAGSDTGPFGYRLNIDPTGQMTAETQTGYTPKILFLDGVVFDVD